jgi:hypothetical protein
MASLVFRAATAAMALSRAVPIRPALLARGEERSRWLRVRASVHAVRLLDFSKPLSRPRHSDRELFVSLTLDRSARIAQPQSGSSAVADGYGGTSPPVAFAAPRRAVPLVWTGLTTHTQSVTADREISPRPRCGCGRGACCKCCRCASAPFRIRFRGPRRFPCRGCPWRGVRESGFPVA